MPGLLARRGTEPGSDFEGPVGPGREAAPDGAQGGVTQASPEQQELYGQFMAHYTKLVYDDANLPGIVKRLEATGNPVEALAATTAMVVRRVQDSAEKAGVQVPPEVTFNAGQEILLDLVELAKDSDIHEFTPQEVEAATHSAIQLYSAQDKALQGGLAGQGTPAPGPALASDLGPQGVG